MPEVIDSRLPPWLVERQHFLQRDTSGSTSETILRGMELGMRNRQQQQQLAIQTRSALMQLQLDQVKKEQYLLDTQEKMLELDDIATIRKAQHAYVHGDRKVAPELSTWQGNRIWSTWKSSHDLETTETAELNTFNEAVAKLDGYGIAAVRAMGDWEKGSIRPEHYQILGNEQQRVREQVLKSKAATQIVEIDGQKYIQNLSTGGLHVVPKNFSEGAPAIPIETEDGQVLGYALQNSRGGLTQLRAPGGKRHPLQNKLDGLIAELAGEEAAGRTVKPKQLRAEIEALKKVIAADQPIAPSQPSASTNAPAGVLRYDPATRTFK